MNAQSKAIEDNPRYKQEVIRRNCISFQSFTVGGLLITGLILLIGILRGETAIFVPQYICFFIYMVVLYSIARYCNYKQTKYVVLAYYVGLIPVYMGAILMGTVFDSHRPAITIMVFLCGLTLFIIDKPWRLQTYIVAVAAVFAIVSYFVKDSATFATDMINLEIFGMISLAINYVVLSGRIESAKNYLLMQEAKRNQDDIISNIPTGIIVFKVENKMYSIVQVNPSIGKIMNVDSKKVVSVKGDNILNRIHPDDKKIVYDAAVKLATPGTEEHYEFRNLNKDRECYTWMSADGKSVAQTDGSVLVYIGYADISERKEKEEEYQRRITALAEMDDDNLIAKGQHNITKNKVLFFTAKEDYSAQIDGNGTYDQAVKSLVDIVNDENQKNELFEQTNREAFLSYFNKGEVEGSLEFSRTTLGGQTVWTMLRYSLFEEPNTKDVIAFMQSYNITERVTELKIVSKLGNMEYDLFGIVDKKTHKYELLNELNHIEKRKLIKSGDFDEMANERIRQGISEEERKELSGKINLKNIIEQLEKNDIFSVMYTVNDKDGKRSRKRFQFTYLDETKESIMFFRSDITEMYNKEQQQLLKIENALKDAEIASKAKTEFFSRMSHDMRTPMNGILGLTTLSEDENNIENLRENIAKIEESGNYLLGLINDTLDFQRIESGRLTLEPRVIKGREIFENIIDMIKQTAQTKGVTLLIENNNECLDYFIKVDELRIKQIFVNLLSNAIKFTPKGGIVEFNVKSIISEDGISRDVVTVRDTGIGMSEEFLRDRIFKPFSQESNSVTTQYAGSGLGLSIAKRLVDMMGGTIEVQSEVGVGTTFTVYLNIERVNENDAKNVSDEQEEYRQNINDRLAGKNILLVEDYPLNAEIARKLIEKTGCKVDWLQNGQEAVDYFKNPGDIHYNMVLMDIRMPLLDGLEATRQIRQLDNVYAKTIPIIAMTANAYEEDKNKSLEAGMNAHLSKPVEPNKLFDVIMKYI